MIKITNIFILFILLLSTETVFAQLDIIPQPVKVVVGKGEFILRHNTSIIVSGNNDVLTSAKLFSDQIYTSTGYRLKIRKDTANSNYCNSIHIKLITNSTQKEEWYQLVSISSKVEVTSGTAAGAFYGMQTLLQLFPPAIESPKVVRRTWSIPAVRITDYPRFEWRGLLLDVSRHFFTVDEVKRLLDEMAKYKFNLFHWHLTDDQGWRIEIKSLPKLTEIGAYRVPRKGLWWERACATHEEKATYGGFYTQEQIKEVIQYAKERNIDILPEIDVPGHSLAAIAAYPFLSSTGIQYTVNPGCKFYTIVDNALCIGKETTFDFLDKVFTEIAALFPFEYIHIGGDECYKGFWKTCEQCQQRMKDNNLKSEEELQSYFINRLERMLKVKKKKLIGWDEILEESLPPEATVMSWRNIQRGVIAAKAGHLVVMTPFDYAYLDLYQGDPSVEPPTYRMLRLKKVYEFDPLPKGVDSTYILGGQGNLWTESVPTFRHAEYMYWPRSFALAECLWSPAQTKNWNNFISRTETHLQRLSYANVNYATSFYDAIVTPHKGGNSSLLITLDAELDDLEIFYTFDNTNPDSYATNYIRGNYISIPKDADMIKVVTYRNGKRIGKIIALNLTDLAKKVNAKIE